MADKKDAFYKMMSKALSGKDAHVEASNILEGLGWKLVGARPGCQTAAYSDYPYKDMCRDALRSIPYPPGHTVSVDLAGYKLGVYF
jgi:hypothetical protein